MIRKCVVVSVFDYPEHLNPFREEEEAERLAAEAALEGRSRPRIVPLSPYATTPRRPPRLVLSPQHSPSSPATPGTGTLRRRNKRRAPPPPTPSPNKSAPVIAADVVLPEIATSSTSKSETTSDCNNTETSPLQDHQTSEQVTKEANKDEASIATLPVIVSSTSEESSVIPPPIIEIKELSDNRVDSSDNALPKPDSRLEVNEIPIKQQQEETHEVHEQRTSTDDGEVVEERSERLNIIIPPADVTLTKNIVETPSPVDPDNGQRNSVAVVEDVQELDHEPSDPDDAKQRHVDLPDTTTTRYDETHAASAEDAVIEEVAGVIDKENNTTDVTQEIIVPKSERKISPAMVRAIEEPEPDLTHSETYVTQASLLLKNRNGNVTPKLSGNTSEKLESTKLEELPKEENNAETDKEREPPSSVLPALGERDVEEDPEEDWSSTSDISHQSNIDDKINSADCKDTLFDENKMKKSSTISAENGIIAEI